MDASNLEDALTASASIPIVSAPVSDIAGAPPGEYWDGGMIDYHLLLPHSRYHGIVLYPHSVQHVTPGWLDKFCGGTKSRARTRGSTTCCCWRRHAHSSIGCPTATCPAARTSTATDRTIARASETGSA
jgi:hypothetical protein